MKVNRFILALTSPIFLGLWSNLPARAEVVTLVCEIAGIPESRATFDIDVARRTVHFATAPNPQTVSAQVTDRYIIFTSPYTGGVVRIDRRTGHSGGGNYHSVGDCVRASSRF
jgi:hypothetical protein